MAAFAIAAAESRYDWFRDALFSSTRPPRTTPWLYDHLHHVRQLSNVPSPGWGNTYVVWLLFWQFVVNPSLMVPSELIMPLA